MPTRPSKTKWGVPTSLADGSFLPQNKVFRVVFVILINIDPGTHFDLPFTQIGQFPIIWEFGQ